MRQIATVRIRRTGEHEYVARCPNVRHEVEGELYARARTFDGALNRIAWALSRLAVESNVWSSDLPKPYEWHDDVNGEFSRTERGVAIRKIAVGAAALANTRVSGVYGDISVRRLSPAEMAVIQRRM